MSKFREVGQKLDRLISEIKADQHKFSEQLPELENKVKAFGIEITRLNGVIKEKHEENSKLKSKIEANAELVAEAIKLKSKYERAIKDLELYGEWHQQIVLATTKLNGIANKEGQDARPNTEEVGGLYNPARRFGTPLPIRPSV